MLLALTCLGALALGVSLSVIGRSPFPETLHGTPQAHVGFALQQQHSRGDEGSWQQLASDVRALRQALPEDRRAAFNLVAALRGLEQRGQTDWAAAEKSCQTLGWTGCDRQALATLRESAWP